MIFKILFSLLFTFYFLLSTFSTPAYGQELSASDFTPVNIYNVSPTSPIYTDLFVSNMFHTFSCIATGQSVIGQPCLNYQLTKNAQGMIQSTPVLSQANSSGGALGYLGSAIGGLYENPPIRTTEYLASVGSDLGIVKEAKAQVVGSGAGVLEPILNLWFVSRNIAYLVMIIIFVVIGLMVMFRKKLNPQTVISIQAALPGLVIGLVMITFSYFLAGLISDSSFIGTRLVEFYFSSVIKSAPGSSGSTSTIIDFNQDNVLKLLAHAANILGGDQIGSVLDSFYAELDNGRWLFYNPQSVLKYFASFIVAQAMIPFGELGGGVWKLIAGGASFAATAAMPTTIATYAISFITTIMLLYAMFRLLLRLLNSYLMVIFLSITAPFHFLISALPGRQGTATNWIMNLLANVLVFPSVLAVIFLAAFLSGQDVGPIKVVDAANINTGGIIKPAFAANQQFSNGRTFPLLGGFDINSLRALLAFAALLATPTIPDLIVKAIGKPGQAGQAVNQTIVGMIGAGRGQGSGSLRGLQQQAGQVGNLKDTKGYEPVTEVVTDKDGTKRLVVKRYEESTSPLTGYKMGGAAKIASSLGWRNTFGRLGNPGFQATKQGFVDPNETPEARRKRLAEEAAKGEPVKVQDPGGDEMAS